MIHLPLRSRRRAITVTSVLIGVVSLTLATTNLTATTFYYPSQFGAYFPDTYGAAASGDTIVIEPGTYEFSHTFNKPGVVILGADREATVIRHTKWTIDVNSTPWMTIKNLSFEVGGAEALRIARGCYLDSCRIYGGAGFQQGAVYAAADFVINACDIFNNASSNRGGAIYVAGSTADCAIQNCRIYGNSAIFDGGGIFVYPPGPTISRNVFYNNAAGGKGGALMYYSGQPGFVFQNTFTYNTAPHGSAVWFYSASVAVDTCVNNIFAFNSVGPAVENGVSLCYSGRCNCYWENPGGHVGWGNGVCPDPDGMNQCLVADPAFCVVEGVDVSLECSSPCLANPNCGRIGASGQGCCNMPTAYIDDITPNPAPFGQNICFTGHGTDPNGTVSAYSWASDIDGTLSDQASFCSSSLSGGVHLVSFRVRDNEGNWSNTATELLEITCSPTIQLVDRAYSPLPLGRVVSVYRLRGESSDYPGTYMGERATNTAGEIEISSGWFAEGDQMRLVVIADTVPAVKHQTLLPNRYEVQIDNQLLLPDGTPQYTLFECTPWQVALLEHLTLRYDLLISVEWDASQGFLDSLENGLRMVSNTLYDVSDGQVCLGRVLIADSSYLWTEADIQVLAHNHLCPSAPPNGISFVRDDQHIRLSRITYFDGTYPQLYLTASLYPYRFTIPITTYGTHTLDYCPVRTIVHEFGHYALGLYDEYCDVSRNYIFEDYDFGIMDQDSKRNCPQCTELSGPMQYSDPIYQVTEQWVRSSHFLIGQGSCWEALSRRFQGYHDGISFSPQVPYSGPHPGPNDDPQSPSCDVGSELIPIVLNHSGVVCDQRIRVIPTGFYEDEDIVVPLTRVFTVPNGIPIYQGSPSPDGLIICVGLHGGDLIRAYTVHPFFASATVPVDLAWCLDRNIADTLVIELRSLSSDYAMQCSGHFLSETSLHLSIALSQALATDPSLALVTQSGVQQNLSLVPVPEGYESLVDFNFEGDGTFIFSAQDDSGGILSVHMPFTTITLAGSVTQPYSIVEPTSGCQLMLDSVNANIRKVLILASEFPALQSDVDSSRKPIGGSIHIATSPPDVYFEGTATLSLPCATADSVRNAVPKIARWNASVSDWAIVGGKVDAVQGVVKAPIQQSGTYAMLVDSFVCGDIDGNGGSINVSDLTYFIAYLFRGASTPPVLNLADVNGTGTVDIADLTYLVAFLFRGGPAPSCI